MNKEIKTADTSDISRPFGSQQAIGKVVKRTALSLPKSPRKRLFIVEAVAKRVGLAVQKNENYQSSTRISDETKKSVIYFFLFDDISWQAPGRKDVIAVWGFDQDERRVKESVQVRYMLKSLMEGYAIFNSNQPSIIGKSKFFDLRPPNVKLFDHLPHNVYAHIMKTFVFSCSPLRITLI